jgi:proline reductase-associated electron transfer protein PrdC
VFNSYKIPLKQHIGSPSIPLVKTGDVVVCGQLIAGLNGLGVNQHASASGKIIAVNDAYIEIEKLSPENNVVKSPPCTSPTQNDIVDLVRAAGLSGMGGAGFPTHVKLGTHLDDGVILANAAECEPLLAHNIRQLESNPELIYRGICYAMKATGAAKGILAIKEKHEEAIRSFQKIIKPADRIEIFFLRDLYPMGEERAIVRDVLGTLLDVSQLPSAAKAVVLNIETLSRIAEAVELHKPVITKNLTVVGKFKSGRESRVFFDVPIGTSIRDLVEEMGGIDGNYGEIIAGGPFTGKRTDLDDVVTKTTGGIIVTIEFPKEKRPLGLLVCACGGNEERLREIAVSMESEVVSVEHCKQAKDVKGALKCENPGNCPGQAEKILELRKKKAQALLISNCSDCTNTVMCVAPKLNMPVYHCTDHVMRTVNHPLIRRLK